MGNAHSIKLTYFDMKGIAEPIRLAFTIGGIKFEDHRIKREDWAELKPKTPYGGLPLLEVDGKTYAQADAILKTAGRLTNLYPKGLLDQLKVDEYLGAAQDILSAIQPSLRESDDKKKAEMRKTLATETLPMWLDIFNKILEENTQSGYLYGKSLTIADLKLYSLLAWIQSGVLDGIPGSLVTDRPKLVEFVKLIESNEKVAEYQKASA